MGKKIIKCAVVAVIIFLAIYNSIYFRKLSEVKAEAKKDFNAAAYAKEMFNKIPVLNDKVIKVDDLIKDINTDKKKAFSQYGRVLAIGSKKYFLVSGEGFVGQVYDDGFSITTLGHNEVRIATEFIFGNAVRDASGLINLNNFSNTDNLNSISSELNKIIREKVVPPFKGTVHKGDNMLFVGAIELNEEHLNLANIEVIPVKLSLTY